jgi:hypothetical protein
MSDVDDIKVEISERERTRIRKRVLAAEKEKLDLKLPRGINGDIQNIIREEVE